MRQGITDEKFESVFRPVVARIIESYRPTAVVLQCGADSLTGDRLGCFNLTLKGHAKCVEYVKSFGLPLIVLGGGGYTIRNVARCWAYETAVLLDQDLPDAIPPNDYSEFYRPDYKLHLTPAQMEDFNTTDYLERHKAEVLENIRQIEHAPSVPFQSVPPDYSNIDEGETDERVPDDERALGMYCQHHYFNVWCKLSRFKFILFVSSQLEMESLTRRSITKMIRTMMQQVMWICQLMINSFRKQFGI